MMKHLYMVGLVFAVGCSGSSSSSSSSGSTGGSTGGSTTTSGGGTGGSSGNTGTMTMTGPYAYSGTVQAGAYSVSGGSATQVDVRLFPGSDAVAITASLLVPAMEVKTYNTADFANFGMGVSEPHGTDMITDSVDSESLTITEVGPDNVGEVTLHGSVHVAYHGTQPYPDGGQASGAGTLDATF